MSAVRNGTSADDAFCDAAWTALRDEAATGAGSIRFDNNNTRVGLKYIIVIVSEHILIIVQ